MQLRDEMDASFGLEPEHRGVEEVLGQGRMALRRRRRRSVAAGVGGVVLLGAVGAWVAPQINQPSEGLAVAQGVGPSTTPAPPSAGKGAPHGPTIGYGCGGVGQQEIARYTRGANVCINDRLTVLQYDLRPPGDMPWKLALRVKGTDGSERYVTLGASPRGADLTLYGDPATDGTFEAFIRKNALSLDEAPAPSTGGHGQP